MQPGVQSVMNEIRQWSSAILSYAILLAAVGTVGMATLELLKALTRARMRFHRFMIRRWIDQDTHIEKELLRLTTGGAGHANAWYDQPDEGLFAGLRSATTLAVQYPDKYPTFARFLMSDADEIDIAAWKEARGNDATPERRLSDEGPPVMSRIRAGNEARQRILNSVAQNIACLQNELNYIWARGNQACSMVLAGTCLFYFISLDGSVPVSWENRTGLAICGGLLAPFAKDIVTALSSLGSSASGGAKPMIGGL